MNRLISATEIQHRIYLIRDCKVMLDKDLAEIYGVTTKRLNEQVKRNRSRFPSDFVFQLTGEETLELWRSQNATSNLKSQIATSSFHSWGGRRKLPYVFIEHGAVMLACVLKSTIAVDASVQVVRALFNWCRLIGAS